MRNTIISLLLALGLASQAFAAPLKIRPDAPRRYVVVRGDTLWGISGRFLRNHWQWPRLWRMNRDQIKNPHWIYPGEVLVLRFDTRGEPYLSLERGGQREVKLSPRLRIEEQDQSIPSIPASLIEPFLKRPLVVNEAEFLQAPHLVAGPDERMVYSRGDRVYAVGIKEKGLWQAYRLGSPLKDPETGELLGIEAIYGGDLVADKLGEVQTLHISSSTEEIQANDRLVQAPKQTFINYAPHRPEQPIHGRIISAANGVAESGQYYNVAINRGTRDGVELGHVFGIFRQGNAVEIARNTRDLPVLAPLPTEQVGELFVYRVFEKVSYGLVMKSQNAIHVGDQIAPPEEE